MCETQKIVIQGLREKVHELEHEIEDWKAKY